MGADKYGVGVINVNLLLSVACVVTVVILCVILI